MFVCVCLCVSVCLPPRPLLTSGMIWCDIGRVRLVKPILQLFSLLPSINWMGVVLVTCMPGKDTEVDAVLAMEGGV